MSNTTLWLVISAILIIAEVATATLYLLFLAVVALIIAMLAWLNIPFIVQIVLAGILSVCGLFAIYKYKLHQSKNTNNSNKNSNNLEVRQVVKVEVWQGEYTTVLYKGAYWQAQYIGTQDISQLYSGEYIIVNTKASTLLLQEKNINVDSIL